MSSWITFERGRAGSSAVSLTAVSAPSLARAIEHVLDPYFAYRWIGRATRPYWRRRFASLGADSLVYRPQFVHRPDLIAIGSRVWIGQSAWLEVSAATPQQERPVIRLGDGVVLRHHVTIMAAESIVIEDDVLIAAFSSVLDADHTLGPSGNPIWFPQVTAPTRVGRGSWIGERVTVLRGTDIGHHCIIGANSVVKGAIPDYSVAVGAPARVVGTTREMVERAST
jgi:lipopolysaccharide O-acetyltransferase